MASILVLLDSVKGERSCKDDLRGLDTALLEQDF